MVRAVVTPAALATPRIGLLASGRTPDDGDNRWQGGFAYTPERTCDDPQIVVDPCSITEGDYDPFPFAPEEVWEPYGVHATVQCSTLGSVSRDDEALARRRLLASEQRQIERELWRGDRARTSGWTGNRFLASSTADVLSPADTGVALTHGLACLEEYLADTLDGAVGMIHATRQVVTHWRGLDLVRREGNLLLTAFDTRVVPGSGGYDGSGPAPDADSAPVAAATGDVWAYATEQVDVRLGEIQIVGPDVDRSVNTRLVRAQRFAVASWDGCAHGAVQLDVTTCEPVGS